MSAAIRRASGDLAGRARALNEIILLKYGYCGDELTYDDLQNANLMRVIDRRKGLPVVLGILFIDAARAQGWEAAGLAFPGHFLIRLAERAERLILDPFHGGAGLRRGRTARAVESGGRRGPRAGAANITRRFPTATCCCVCRTISNRG